ncbi:MAG: hypothetical protein RML40_11460 [Bacteroidota bacterium]|nr:hypothetical protein [Candidatus Kapabacteria bacterium]MDW8221133.1 hypothetical protein [Bacteroidota bacterium]
MSEQNLPTTDTRGSEYIQQHDGAHWIIGFIDIIAAPKELALRHVVYPARVIVFAVLLITAASTLVQFMYSRNSAIQEQMYQMQARSFERMAQKQGVSEAQIDEQLDRLRKELEFSLPKTLGISLIFTFLTVFVYGMLFWVLQRLFNSEAPPVSVIIALVNYTASIEVIGSVVIGLMQYFANSIAVSISPALLIDASDNPYLLQFLARINPFTIWEYLVAGFVVGLHVGMSRVQGLSIGAAALLLSLMFTGGFTYAMSRIMG